MFNQIKLINCCLLIISISIDFTLGTSGGTRDLINFNVYQTGSRIHGHYKLPGQQLKVNFQLDVVNLTFYTFNLVSGQPRPFDVNGNVTLVKHNNGLLEIQGKASSESAETQITLNSNVTRVAKGHLVETKVNLNVSNLIINYSNQLDLLENCWPFNLRHNFTTVPVNLVSYNSEVNGYCKADPGETNDNNNVTLWGKLESSEWYWLNTTIDQIWTFNETGGYEKMTFDNVKLGSMVVLNDWVNRPIPITRKRAVFSSHSTLLPTFQVTYLVDGRKRSLSYERLSP